MEWTVKSPTRCCSGFNQWWWSMIHKTLWNTFFWCMRQVFWALLTHGVKDYISQHFAQFQDETDKIFHYSLKIWTPCYRFLDLGSPVCSDAQKYSWHILIPPSPYWHFFDSIHWQLFATILAPFPSKFSFYGRPRKSWQFMIKKKEFSRKILQYQNAGHSSKHTVYLLKITLCTTVGRPRCWIIFLTS